MLKVRAAAGDGGDGDDERGAVALPVRVDDNLDQTTLCLGTARESDVQLIPPQARVCGAHEPSLSHTPLAPMIVPSSSPMELAPRLNPQAQQHCDALWRCECTESEQ